MHRVVHVAPWGGEPLQHRASAHVDRGAGGVRADVAVGIDRLRRGAGLLRGGQRGSGSAGVGQGTLVHGLQLLVPGLWSSGRGSVRSISNIAPPGILYRGGGD
jgi:hypothetical protein